jgi:tRNA threonylcarbamoyladenosine modification (KEOPS) complex  Pcc1 subunit
MERYKAKINIYIGNESKIIVSLMDREIKYKRSRITVKRHGGAIDITVHADDPVALISSINSVIKQLRVITRANKVMDSL